MNGCTCLAELKPTEDNGNSLREIQYINAGKSFSKNILSFEFKSHLNRNRQKTNTPKRPTMNFFQLFSSLLLLCIGLATAAPSNNGPPKRLAHLAHTHFSSVEQNIEELACRYNYLMSEEHPNEEDWQVTVSFHKMNTMACNSTDQWPIVAEFRREGSGNNMAFHTVKSLEGVTMKRSEDKENPEPFNLKLRLTSDKENENISGLWKCSLLRKLKSSSDDDSKSRTMSNTVYISEERLSY